MAELANRQKPEEVSKTLSGKTSSSVTEERRESQAISRVLAAGSIGSPEEKDSEDTLARVDKFWKDTHNLERFQSFFTAVREIKRPLWQFPLNS